MALRSSASLSIRGLRECFFFGGCAEEEVPSLASGSSAAGLSDSPLALAPDDDFFLFFHSSDILSLDFREDSDIGFPSSTEEEVGEFIALACIN